MKEEEETGNTKLASHAPYTAKQKEEKNQDYTEFLYASVWGPAAPQPLLGAWRCGPRNRQCLPVGPVFVSNWSFSCFAAAGAGRTAPNLWKSFEESY